MILRRIFALVLGLGLLAACAKDDLKDPPVPLGDFVLGLNIAVADNMDKVPISREATEEEWETAMVKAIDDRFGRYEGTRIYNIGIAVNAYALAPPSIPVVAAPRSVLVVTANIWDDATGQKLNPIGKQITVLEDLSPESVIGTGLTSSKAQQMKALSYNVAVKVQEWMLRNPQWFTDTPTVGDMTENDQDMLSSLLPDSTPTGAAAPAATTAAPAASAPTGTETVLTSPLPTAEPVN